MSESLTPPFDPVFWRAANAALDDVLELAPEQQSAYLTALTDKKPGLAAEVKRLLRHVAPGRAHDAAQAPRLGTVPRAARVTPQQFTTLLSQALLPDENMGEHERRPGERFGHWRIEKMLGRGGMGEVWLAERADGLYDAKAAVKFLRTDPNATAFEVRFAQERALLGKLSHPRIARLLDAENSARGSFLVLEYVAGKPLIEFAEAQLTTIAARLKVLQQIAEAVAYAHSQLVVHRDIKPSNVMVTDDGSVKLLDFGVAGLLDANNLSQTTESPATQLVGRGLTVEYAAPEQIAGESSGVACDVYSLGALGFHLLTGRRPHQPSTPGRAALEHAILHIDAPRLSRTAAAMAISSERNELNPPRDFAKINADLDAIFARALRRSPSDRYANVSDFLADLRRFSEQRPIAARAHDRAYRTRLWLQRNWLPVALAISLFVALAGGLATSLWQAERANAEAARATKTADYLIDLLAKSDPALNGGQWPTALTLLERAKQDVGARFANDPETEARLSTMLTKTFRSLSRDTEALPIAKRALELAELLHGPNDVNTALARADYAEILYWLEDEVGALAGLEQALSVLQEKLPRDDIRLTRAQLARANTLARLFRFDESERAFQTYLSTLQPAPRDQWRRAEAEGDYARALTSQGRWAEAHQMLLRNEAAYRNPPAGEEKLALHNLQSLTSTQVVVGRYDGAEARLLKARDAWTALAGAQSMQVFDVNNELGYLYYRLGDGAKAEASYRTLRALQDQLPDFDELRKLSTDIDILEVQTLFGRVVPNDLVTGARYVAERMSALARAKSERGVWLATRLALLFDAAGDDKAAVDMIDTARKTAIEIALEPGPWLNRIERAQAGIERRRNPVATSANAAATAKTLERVRDIAAKSQRGGFSQRVVGAHLEFAMAVAALDAAKAKAAIANARAALPLELPEKHYARALLNYVEALALTPSDLAAIDRSAAEFARSLGHPDTSQVRAPLASFYFL